MIQNQELINRIKDHFDLNIYETKVWLALLSKGIASAGDIAKISRVPRSRTYDVLEGLEKKGFAIEKLGKPVMYIGVKPRGILEKLKNNVKKYADEKINFLTNIKETEEFIALEKLYKSSVEPFKKEELPLSLKGKEAISNYVKELIEKTKKEIIICNDSEHIHSKAKLFKKTIDSLKKAGVEVKMALFGEKELIEQLEKLLELKIRKIEANARFFIIDRKEILFYLSKENEDENAIIVNSEFFAKAFSDIFEMGLKGDNQ
ncbi:MAG TPA: helix-turn-helix domain-containing protein [Candidatus Omnitrophota bacterium]|nr:helix-turn-helix domain-containing protein [Candidatus Omnitrophota bacterium]